MPSTESPTTASSTRPISKLAIPFLGLLAGIQGSAPNISSTGLVSASRGLHMASGDVALAASIQSLTIAASVITTGLIADRLGRRRVLMAALVVGAIGAAMIGLAPNTLFYLLGEVIIGIGLGATYGAAFAYIRAVAAPGKLAGAVGVFGAAVGATTLLLTFFGGALVGIDWRVSHAIVPVLAVACAFVVPLLLPVEKPVRGGSLDIIGQLLLAIGIIAFLYGISQLGHSLTSPQTLGPIIGGAITIAAFFVYEAKTENGFYPVRLFREPLFIGAILAGFIYNFGTAVAFLQLTNLWQYVTGLKGSEVALWQLPLVASGIVGALIIGRLMTKGMTNAVALIIGTGLVVVGFVALALAHDSKSFLAFLPGLILAGAGVVACSIPFGNLIIKEAPPAQYGPVTSSRTTIGQFVYSIGLALSTVIIDKLTVGGVVHKLDDAGVQPDQIGTAISSVTVFARSGTDPSTELGRKALADAVTSYGNAFSTMMYLAAAIMLVVGIIGFLTLRKTDEGHPDPKPAPADATPSPA